MGIFAVLEEPSCAELAWPGASKEPLFPDGILMTAAIWTFGWWAFARLLCGSVAAYALAVALGTHIRFPPPLGQVPPMPDPVLLFAWAWSAPLAGLSLAAAAWASHRGATGCALYWACAALTAAASAYRYRSATGSICTAFEEVEVPRDAFLEISANPPQQPPPTYLYAYFYYFFSSVRGRTSEERVRITRHRRPGCASAFDLWLRDGAAAARRPVFVFVHGGGWRGGEARAHAQAPLLQALAMRGWFVVSLEYRKSHWPQHLDDCWQTLRWVCSEEAAAQGADKGRLFLAGTSAGGHIASLLTLRLLREQPCLARISGLVLFYPALDPGDCTRATATFPLSLPCLKIWCGRSLMAWFFEMFVLRGDSSLWHSAQLLYQLRSDRASACSWPPTLIVHGEKDSVVPLAHCRHLLALLAAAEGGAPESPEVGSCRAKDTLIVVPGGRHTWELAATSASWAAFSGVLAWLERSLQC